ncbi:MAG: FGGY-family carbohydrate kinase [Corallococcus sp.]|nr:FGGY-family carbohydrate kinase [Corallococcus sp.]
MSNVLVVDVGTQSMRGIIFDDKGNLLAKEQVKYKPYISKENGYMEQSAEMYWEVLCGITSALRAKNPELMDSIIAMSVDTFRDTAVLLDKDRNVIRNCILWSDMRTADTSKKLPLKQRFLFKLVGMSRPIKAIRGRVLTNWIQDNEPELWARVDKVILISGYLNYKLTGNLVDSYASNIAHLPIDYKTKKWHTKNALLFPVYNLPLSKMIPLCNPGDVMGTVSDEVSKITGLPQGLKIIASGSDKSCETLGGGCLAKNVASVSFGTSSTVQFSNKKYFEPEPFMPSYPSVVKEYYNAEVQIFRGYWMISWFKKHFAQHLEKRSEETGKSVEELMNEEMESIPAGSDGLILQPFWQAGLTHPEAKGSIIGFNDWHTRAHVYKAIVEGIDYALREGLERMERRGRQKIDFITVSGGGAQSDLICQIAADIFNKPVKRVQTYETCALGCAIVTFAACGTYKSVEEAFDNMVRFKDTFTPNPENVAIYDDIYKNVYLKLYKKLQKLYLHMDKHKGN